MKHQLQQIREALTAAANLIAHQYSGTSVGMTALQDASDDCLEALTALSELERMEAENAKLREALEDIGQYTGEGPISTPWRDIVKACGEKARAALENRA